MVICPKRLECQSEHCDHYYPHDINIACIEGACTCGQPCTRTVTEAEMETAWQHGGGDIG